MALDRGAPIKIFASAGEVRLVGWDRDSLAFDASVPRSETFTFLGDSHGAKFGVFANGREGAAAPAFLTAYVPRASRVSVKSASASIDGADVSGFFYTVTGPIRLRGSAREIDAQSLAGAVSIVATVPWIRARTANGSLTLRGTVEDVGLATVTGNVDIDAGSVVRLQVQTVDGRVEIAPFAVLPALVDVDTHSGAIGLTLPRTPETGYSVVAQSVRGTIDTSLIATFAGRRGSAFLLRLGRERDSVPKIRLTTFDGPIRVRAR